MSVAGMVTAKELAAMLAQNIEAVCAQVLPAGKKQGSEYVDAKTSAGGLGDSMKVHLSGAKRGTFAHFGNGAAGSKGDALDLVAYVLCGGDKKRAFAWGRAFLGLDNIDPKQLERRRVAARKSAADAEKRAEAEARGKRAAAWRIFQAAIPIKRGDLVDRYLLGRGIDLRLLPRAPRCLRLHPSLENPEDGVCYPAMVALIGAPLSSNKGFAGIHRTWLEERADGSVGKAPMDNPKMSLGPYQGGCIHLTRGVSEQRFRDATGTIHISEGIEDGLSVAVAMPEVRVAVAVSLSMLASLELPAGIEEVCIIGQNDAGGSLAAAQVQRAAQAFIAQRRRVRLPRPPEGVKDVNELLQAKG